MFDHYVGLALKELTQDMKKYVSQSIINDWNRLDPNTMKSEIMNGSF